ncbi:TonB-dependent receptor [Mucilaginibacter gynuensis]|uniref:TonB-dependent receptor n=1 Tax=Mucilaginibacter gynuensis TaxID=1302236 RepID=A0ABP8G6V5_9SPHI
MKKLLLLLLITIYAGTTFAQRTGGGGGGGGRQGGGGGTRTTTTDRQNNPNRQQQTGRPQNETKPPLPFREVSGIIKDTADNGLIGATVKLKISATDSISTTTNEDGVFIIPNVKSATFVVTISSIGYKTVVKKMLNNDVLPRLVLDPFILKSEEHTLEGVTVNGTPSITYKTDTVEYRASDYKVRPNATVDELLKKMEGMEVGSDGSVTHQGQKLTKAKLNGKDYAGGDLAKAIQSLPADIVEKIQVVDDYGDQAARTGIKDGDPQKILNITTKPDRSVGHFVRANAGIGSQKRFESNVNANRINGNQVVVVDGNLRNTINGVGSGGGSGGTTKASGINLNYRDQLSKKVQINTSYRFNNTRVNSINRSEGQQFTDRGTINFRNSSDSRNRNNTHNFNFELEYNIDSANYLKVSPYYNYSGAFNSNTSSTFRTGAEHRDIIGTNSGDNTTPNYGGFLFYQHLFKKKRRNFSIQLNISNNDQENVNIQNNNLIYYRNDSDSVSIDSLVYRNIARSNLTKNYRTSATYVEPLDSLSQLEFNAQVNRRSYSNEALTSNIDSFGQLQIIDSLSNIFNYAFTEARFAVNYRLNQKKYNLSLGVTAVPTLLEGTKVSLGNVSIHRTNFNLIPIARFEYAWSRQERFSINYSGNPNEPSFDQIQPVRDESNPQSPVVGNPNLKPAFVHTVNLRYNNYITNSRLNFSANVGTRIVNNRIVNNTIQILDPRGAFIYERNFVNIDGNYSVNGNYSISKQLADRKYNLSLNGGINYNHDVSMTNNRVSLTDQWNFNQRLGPRINPNENIEVNPYVGYDVTRTYFSLTPDKNTNRRTTTLSIDGQFFFLKERTLRFGYSANKNFIQGVASNVSRNPLVINARVEKEFFARRNLTLTFQVFDILKQNNFVDQTITSTSITNTLTNALSRYFMFSARVNLQKWSGSPKRNGRSLQRRGDGSFIY